MIKAIVIVCPNDFRKEFCQNFFELFKREEKNFLVATLETTERDQRLTENEDYIFVDRKLFKDLKKDQTHFLAWAKKGLNGSAVYSGFAIDSFNIAKEPTIAVYVTHNDVLGRNVCSFYKKCSSSYDVPIIQIMDIGILEDFKESEVKATFAPEVPERIYNHLFKEKSVKNKELLSI